MKSEIAQNIKVELAKESEKKKNAPGTPGLEPRWTSSIKSGIGKSINTASNITFTLGNGIINEVFYPREDVACVRDMEFLITDGKEFFSEEKRDSHHEIKWIEEGVPAYEINNSCHQNKYLLNKIVIADPIRNTLLQQVTLTNTSNNHLSELKLYVLLAPHLLNKGYENNAWKGKYKNVPMLFASRKDTVLAMVCSTGFIKSSVGYVGFSDGYTDVKKHFEMQWEYENASQGNVALSAEINCISNKPFVIAVGFGQSADEAGNNAWSSILDGFGLAKAKYVFEWQRWQRKLSNVKSDRNRLGRQFRKSAAILRIHESRNFPGGILASLSIPWGNTQGDDNSMGYHLVWPRDLALSSGGFMELNAKDDVLRILNYLMTTQQPDGSWSQNMYLEGIPHWKGIQMDQVAFPLLLVGAAYEKGYISEERCKRYWPVVKNALSFILQNGPYTMQDRWEEESGFTPFTMATQIAALLSGAFLAVKNKEEELAAFCIETSDYWNQKIEYWTYVTDTSLSKKTGVEGYYIRINPYDQKGDDIKNKTIRLKNHTGSEGDILLGELVSVDALALVRFGLRDAHDPKILNTIKVIDATLKTDTPTGPCWHRYVKDGYGENAKGDPYSGTGIGRAWPLLTGERAHYEICAGNFDKAKMLLRTMETFANNSLFPEQVWDTKAIPGEGLFPGRPTGSAMPLTWAHAEYLKLCSSIKHRRLADLPGFTRDRYIENNNQSNFEVWSTNRPIENMNIDKQLRIQLPHPALVHFTEDDWKTSKDLRTKDIGIGIHFVDIIPANAHSHEIKFTFYWPEESRWEQKDYTVYRIMSKNW